MKINRLTLLTITMIFAAVTASRSPAAEPVSTIADVAGSYYQGDGLGVNLSLNIEPDGTFSHALRGCLGTYAEASGTAVVENGALLLHSSKSHSPNDHRVVPEKLLPVRWGDRTYLLENFEIKGFCNAVNVGHEPRKDAHGTFYLGRDQWTKPVEGLPVLPAPYDRYLLTKPLEGKILERDAPRRAWVNLGLDQGVFAGMEMVASDREKRLYSSVTVTLVERERCRVTCASYSDKLIVGESVSSHTPQD